MPRPLRNSAAVGALPYTGVPTSNSFVRASPPTTTGSKPASLTSRIATLSAAGSSAARGIATLSPARCASLASCRKPTELNARTSRVPGRNSGEATPVPFSRAATAISPSRCGYGFAVSRTTLPLIEPARSRPSCGNALYGTEKSSTSPKAAASAGVPALAPTRAASFLSASRSSEENITSCPAFAHSSPTVPPMRPEPITPIFSFGASSAATAESDRAQAAKIPATNARRLRCVESFAFIGFSQAWKRIMSGRQDVHRDERGKLRDEEELVGLLVRVLDRDLVGDHESRPQSDARGEGRIHRGGGDRSRSERRAECPRVEGRRGDLPRHDASEKQRGHPRRRAVER